MRAKKLRRLTLAGVIFLSIFFLVLLFGNFMAIQQQVAYTLSPPTVVETSPEATANGSLPAVSPTSTTPQATPDSDENRLRIAKIAVDAPLQLDIPGDSTEKFLNKGLVHLEGSAHPGELGNFFVSGHSSDYPWRFDKYASVFALLPKLKAGDEIIVQYQRRFITYVVTRTEVVSPDRLEITNQTGTAEATLMTCYPIGTTRSRFVVHAALVP